MYYNPKVHYIPPRTKPIKRVGIYCRVSTSKEEQLKSLPTQISELVKYVASHSTWRIVEMYVEIQSAKGGTNRSEMDRLIEDCKRGVLDILVMRDVSRLGRDTVETLETYRAICHSGVRVIFHHDNLDSEEVSSELMISIIESIHQSENESRSENIKLGLQQRAMDGTSRLYNRKCYGYMHDDQGELIPHPEQAKVVQQIFDWYMDGESVLGIVRLLEKNKIPSPRGKSSWPKRTIDTMLSNEKYYGDVILNNATPEGNCAMSQGNHSGIITRDQFEAVQEEKARRCNIVWQDGEAKRARRKYS